MKMTRISRFLTIMAMVTLLSGCKTAATATDGGGETSALSAGDDGKVAVMDKDTFQAGDYLTEPGVKSVWKKEIIGTKEIAPTYEKWGKPVKGVGGMYQVQTKVRHFQFRSGEVEYVYCRKYIGHDKNQLILMPRQLKKSGQVRNVTVLKTVDWDTDEVSTKKL